MADSKVSNFPQIGSLAGPEIFYVADAGTDKYCTSDQIKTFVDGATTKTVYFKMDYDSNAGSYRVQNISGVASARFSFVIPPDFASLVTLELIFFPESGAAGSGKDIDLTSEYAADGELSTTNSESDTTTTYDLGTADTFGSYSIASVFSSLSAEDRCGILIDHNSIGGTVHYLFIKLVYNT